MILDDVRLKAVPILRGARVARAAVFGSVARGEEDAGDIDILVEMPRPYGLFAFLSIKADLEEALQRKVDLVEYAVLKPSIRQRALQAAVEII